MPKECRNCNNKFPYEKVIGGKKRSLSSREYCLKCSPFGSHNTKQIEKDNRRELSCSLCSDTYTYQSSSGKSTKYCPSCMSRRKRRAYRNAVIKIFGEECVYCGENGCHSKLSIHHKEDKNFNFQRIHKKSFESIAEEIRGCELLCENCHTKHHCEGSRGYCPEHEWSDKCCTENDECNKSCHVMFLRHERRNKAIKNKGGECSRCGYSGCTSAFSFHHKQPDKKQFSLDVTAFSRSMESINEEVKKCELLCHNCHQTHHCDCEVNCSDMFKEYTERAKSKIQEYL